MYCSSCGVAVAQGLSYCNYCGAKLGGVKGDDVVKSPDIRPEKLVEMMGAVFVCGLGFIAVLIGVLKAVAGFDVPLLVAVLIFSFLMMIVIEGVLTSLLLKGKRGPKEADHTTRLKDQTTKELGEAQARMLPEPLPSVTEHTTRAFAPIHHERESK